MQIGDGTGTYHAERILNDYIITVGDDSVTLKNAADINRIGGIVSISPDKLNILGTADTYTNLKLIYGSEDNDTINNTFDDATINALVGDDTISNNGSNVSINGGAGDVIELETSVDGLESIEGGVQAGDITIYGITKPATETSWETTDAGVVFKKTTSAGVKLDGN